MINHADARSRQLAWQITRQIGTRNMPEHSPLEKTTQLGSRKVSRTNADERLTRAFINRCTDSFEARHVKSVSYPEPSELISASDLHAVLLQQADSRKVKLSQDAQINPSILERVRGWIGLSSPVSAGNGRGLLDRIAQTGLPLRHELIEGFEALHQNLKKIPFSNEQLHRAQGGAVLLDQLRQIGELLRAAQSLTRAGHGMEAGFDAGLLRKLDDDIALTERAITHVIALKDESVQKMPEKISWQDWVIKH
jgi:hypothetical protein